MISGIRTTLPLYKADIASIERKELPADFFTPPKVATPPTPTPPPPPQATQPARVKDGVPTVPNNIHGTPYLLVPLVGVFGKDIFPEGVEDALVYADKQEAIKHIVFVIDSDGGYIWAANKILEVLEKYETRFQYHIIIKKAISASIWAVFECNTIHMVDGSTVGGAVVFREGQFGNTQVDAKMNSIICAKIVAEAEKKGHPSILVKPMMIQGGTVAAWRDAKGVVKLALRLPANVSPEAIVFECTPNEILTLTKEQAVAAGLAQAAKGGAETLGADLKLDDWNEFNTYGEWAMKRSQVRDKKKYDAVIDNGKRLHELQNKIESNLEEAVQNDPNSGQYALDRSARFTPESVRTWQKRTDRSLDAWNRVLGSIKEFKGIEEQLKPFGVPKYSTEMGFNELSDRASREIKTLFENRGKTGM
jgi:hypothetical protein